MKLARTTAAFLLLLLASTTGALDALARNQLIGAGLAAATWAALLIAMLVCLGAGSRTHVDLVLLTLSAVAAISSGYLIAQAFLLG